MVPEPAEVGWQMKRETVLMLVAFVAGFFYALTVFWHEITR